MTKREQKYLRALVHVAQVLGYGSCTANKCEGCQYEMQEAAIVARRAAGMKVPRKKKHSS